VTLAPPRPVLSLSKDGRYRPWPPRLIPVIGAGEAVGHGGVVDQPSQPSFLSGRVMQIEPSSVRGYSSVPINDRHETSCEQ